MTNTRLFLLIIILSAVNPFLLEASQDGDKNDLTRLVNPMTGTDGHGHTFPGATLPFGMIQLSPDTRTSTWDGCSGYHYSDKSILGFSHTHFSGTGVGSGADILLMPFIGEEGNPKESALENGTTGYRTGFSHADETASPGYYSVRLNNGILAELSCTERVGIHRYTFPKGVKPAVLLDLVHGITTTVDSLSLEIVNPTTVRGYRRAHSSLDGNKLIWYVLQFSEPFENWETELGGKKTRNLRHAMGKELKAYFHFKETGKPILAKVSLSRVDMAGAGKNLAAELPGWNFGSVRERARAMWQKELAKIEIEGGSTEQRRTFYTALYHCMIHPNIFMDTDRRYMGTDHKIHKATGFDNYTTFSMWDTFRALHPLFTIIDQQRTRQYIRSITERFENAGDMMIMEFGGNEGYGMIGYHTLSLIADAYVKGIRGFDIPLTYRGMKKLSEGFRAGKEAYKIKGFVPYDFDDQSVSRTLEYAYDDWCVSRLAKDLDSTDFHLYSQKGNFYRNLYSAETGFMRGKSGNYVWQQPFDPKSTSHFTEGNAYQYSLFVPQDYQGLFRLMGGDAAVDKWLDKCFETVLDENQARTGDMTGNIGQYAHGNEPSHHMAYLYNYLGKPWKSQFRVRQVMDELYHDGPGGLCGNEDCGQMSAWYVFSAMGFYPATPGMDYYVLGSPLFSRVTIRLENGKKFTLKAPLSTPSNKYIQSARLNGKSITRTFLLHQEIMKGGELTLDMTDQPDHLWGTSLADRPWSDSYPSPLMPEIMVEDNYFSEMTRVTMSCKEESAQIRYTLDGSDPTSVSALYNSPIVITKSALLKARSFLPGMYPSFPASANLVRMEKRAGTAPGSLAPGLLASYFEGHCTKLAEMKNYQVIHNGILPGFDITSIKDDRPFGYYFSGYLEVLQSGVYTICLNSNDGSRLMVDGHEDIVNDGFHRAQERVCKLFLEKGMHSIRVDYFQMGGAKELKVSWSFENGPREEIPSTALWHQHTDASR